MENFSFFPSNISNFLAPISMIDDYSDYVEKLKNYKSELDAELTKIQVFKRDLPLCAVLVNEAIERLNTEIERCMEIKTKETVTSDFKQLKGGDLKGGEITNLLLSDDSDQDSSICIQDSNTYVQDSVVDLESDPNGVDIWTDGNIIYNPTMSRYIRNSLGLFETQSGLKTSSKESLDMSASVKAVEEIIPYKFKDKTLLEMALTHGSCKNLESYERLEFVGDACLGLAITNFVFVSYPNLHPGDLTRIKAANVSTEKLARVAVHHGLYKYLRRHNGNDMDEKVNQFCELVQEEDEFVLHGGEMKAPKFLADIVEAIIAAVYVDVQFDLKAMWLAVEKLLKPLITREMLMQQPHPVSVLFEACQKDQKQVDIKHHIEGEKFIASVYVDREFIVSASSGKKERAKLLAAEAAVKILPNPNHNRKSNIVIEIESAKRMLNEVCQKNRWSNPSYSIVRMAGPAHCRTFACSVTIETGDTVAYAMGDEKLRVKDSEASAALVLLQDLQDQNCI